MPDKHFYFSMGATVGSGISYYIYHHRHQLEKNNWIFRKLRKKTRHWFLYFPIFIFALGLWGLIPDVLHALHIFPKEVTRSNPFNIFFFHSYFEYIEDKYLLLNRILNWIGEGFLFMISIGIMCFYIFQIKKLLEKE